MIIEGTIKWVETQKIEDVTFKIGDYSHEDDDIFFYFSSIAEMALYRNEGEHEWVIIEIVGDTQNTIPKQEKIDAIEQSIGNIYGNEFWDNVDASIISEFYDEL